MGSGKNTNGINFWDIKTLKRQNFLGGSGREGTCRKGQDFQIHFTNGLLKILACS